ARAALVKNPDVKISPLLADAYGNSGGSDRARRVTLLERLRAEVKVDMAAEAGAVNEKGVSEDEQ
ncbi:MAG: hypothetical protein M1546_16250, partial [Chloroflexi bacterium]|nr:hypothetical protein [Chloroflexota bacterium]